MDKDNNVIKPFGTLTPALRKAVDNIKQAILESQLRATKYANSVELSLYYGIGHYISDNSRDGYWGKAHYIRLANSCTKICLDLEDSARLTCAICVFSTRRGSRRLPLCAIRQPRLMNYKNHRKLTQPSYCLQIDSQWLAKLHTLT